MPRRASLADTPLRLMPTQSPALAWVTCAAQTNAKHIHTREHQQDGSKRMARAGREGGHSRVCAGLDMTSASLHSSWFQPSVTGMYISETAFR